MKQQISFNFHSNLKGLKRECTFWSIKMISKAIHPFQTGGLVDESMVMNSREFVHIQFIIEY